MRRPTDPSLPIDYYEAVFTDDNPAIKDNYYKWYHLEFDRVDGKWICRPYITKGQTGYKIYDEYGLDGGGRSWGSSFPRFYQKLNPGRKFKHCLDWCSGPGYCGFEMMDHELCETLVLMDLHALAIKYADITIEKNQCADRVKSYCIDKISLLPKSEKFDIIIGNPPHSSGVNNDLDADQTRILSDVGWASHQEFFDNVGNYLTDDGVIWLCENGNPGAGPIEIFLPMIKANGFKIKNTFIPEDFHINNNPYYFIEIIRS